VKKFFIKVFLLFTPIVLYSIAVLLIVKFFIYSSILFKIPCEKDIIILGDSHTECAIDDNIFLRAINISASAHAYFYSYVKLREFLKSNSHIKKVILSFHGGSIGKSRDNWIFGEEYMKARVPKYIFFLERDELFLLMKGKTFLPEALRTMMYAGNIILEYITKRQITYKDLGIGGYLWLDRDKLEENIELQKNDESVQPIQYEYSLYELNYLQKILLLCERYNIELILLNSPIYNCEIYGNKKNLSDYYNRYLPKIKYLDFSDYNLPRYGYGDIEHLNYKGAEIFSQYLEDNYETYFEDQASGLLPSHP